MATPNTPAYLRILNYYWAKSTEDQQEKAKQEALNTIVQDIKTRGIPTPYDIKTILNRLIEIHTHPDRTFESINEGTDHFYHVLAFLQPTAVTPMRQFWENKSEEEEETRSKVYHYYKKLL